MRFFLTFILISFGLFSNANAQKVYNDYDALDIALEGIYEGYFYEGFETSENLPRQSLANNTTNSLNFDLDSSQEYVIAAVCPVECKNLSISILDKNGSVIGKTDFIVDLPDANIYNGYFSPEKSGTYKIKFDMIDCKLSKCDIAALIAKKQK